MREKMERFAKFMISKGLNDNQVTAQCGLSVGLLGQARTGKSDLGPKTIDKILKTYPDLSRSWLLAGVGPMLNDAAPAADVEPPLPPGAQLLSQAPSRTVRYYNNVVAFMGDVELCGPQNENYTLVTVPFITSATMAIKTQGMSMYPDIKDGDVVFLKPYTENFIQYDRIYLVVTPAYCVIKRLQPSPNADMVECHSTNPTTKSFSIRKEDIKRLYQVCNILSSVDR